MRDDFDLRERFRGLDRLDPAEDVWAEAERRRPGSVRTAPSSQGRLAAAVLALIVAAAGVLIAVRAFRSAAPGPGTETPPAVTNGPIWFRIGGGDGPSWTDSVEPDGTGRTTVFGPDSGIHADLIAFSPDGSRIAFDHGVTEQYGIETAGLDGSGVVRLTSGPNDSWPSWSPDGTRIVFSGTGERPESQRCVAGDDFHCPTDIYAVAADGGSPVRLTSDPDPEFAPAWSPDGSRIAFLRTLPGTNRTAIFSMAADGSDVRRLSSADGGSDFAPSWAPDGSRLVFAAIRDENWGIWMVDADGTNEHMILGGSGWHAEDPRWSPDGRLIAFVGNPDTGDYSPDDALYVMRQGGSDVTRLATAPGYGVAGDIAWQPGTVGRSAPTAPATPLSPDPQPSAAASCEPAPLFGLHEQCFDPNSDPFHVDGASEVTFAQAEASADFPIYAPQTSLAGDTTLTHAWTGIEEGGGGMLPHGDQTMVALSYGSGVQITFVPWQYGPKAPPFSEEQAAAYYRQVAGEGPAGAMSVATIDGIPALVTQGNTEASNNPLDVELQLGSANDNAVTVHVRGRLGPGDLESVTESIVSQWQAAGSGPG